MVLCSTCCLTRAKRAAHMTGQVLRCECGFAVAYSVSRPLWNVQIWFETDRHRRKARRQRGFRKASAHDLRTLDVGPGALCSGGTQHAQS